MINILHVTHTNISTDVRIIKIMRSLKKINSAKLFGIGVGSGKVFAVAQQDTSDLLIQSIDLIVRNKLNKLPRFVRLLIMYPLWVYIEMIIKYVKASNSRKYDVIHCHDVLVLPIAYLISFKHSAKLVYDAHELESEKNGVGRISSGIIYFFEFVLRNKISLLISVSQSILDWYRDKLEIKNSCLVMNSPDVEFNEVSINDKSGFVYVGILCHGRGIEFLLKFFEINSDLEFTLIGDGVLTDLVNVYAVKCSNIKHISALRHDQLMIELKSFKYGFCFMPESTSLSDFYSLPNKVFEYLFSGVLVISTDLPEISNLLKATNSGICVNFDMDELGVKIRNMPDLCIDYDTLNSYSWMMQESRLIDAYRKMLN